MNLKIDYKTRDTLFNFAKNKPHLVIKVKYSVFSVFLKVNGIYASE